VIDHIQHQGALRRQADPRLTQLVDNVFVTGHVGPRNQLQNFATVSIIIRLSLNAKRAPQLQYPARDRSARNQFDTLAKIATILAMSEQPPFEIIFDDAVQEHFAAIPRQDHSSILDAIEVQLSFEPNVKTRNRKPLRIPNSIDATWELRCGMNNRYRIFYDVDVYDRLVIVLAAGRKPGSRLMIGDKEMEL